MIANIVKPILVVEDNPMDLDLMRRAFERHNLANPIIVARDGEEAVAFLDQWHAGQSLPVVVLLDVKLPRIDGLEVLRIYKNDSLAHKIPVVILTSSGEDSDITRAYELGANSYIIKPVEFEKFLEVASQIKLYWTVINEPPR